MELLFQSTSSFSICSSVLFLVSGNLKRMKMKPSTQITAYSQNVPAGPSCEFKMGNVKTKRKQASQSAATATAIAAPRMRLGKISEMTTHVTGASDIEYAAIAASTSNNSGHRWTPA